MMLAVVAVVEVIRVVPWESSVHKVMCAAAIKDLMSACTISCLMLRISCSN
jgi:hypothetical protein